MSAGKFWLGGLDYRVELNETPQNSAFPLVLPKPVRTSDH